jgi:MFS family permease
MRRPRGKDKGVALWTRDFTALCLLNFFSFSGFWMLPSLLPVYIHSLGAPDYLLGWIAGITAIATVISRPAAGLAVERYGRRGVLVCGLVGMIITSASFAVVPMVGAILAVRFVQGIFWGLNNTAITTVASDNIPKARYAEGMGWYSQGSSLAQILAPALALASFYALGEEVTVTLCAAFFFLALLVSFFIRYRPVVRNRDVDGASRSDAAGGYDGASRSGTADVQPGGIGQAPVPSEQDRGGIWNFVKHTLFERRALFAGLMMLFCATAYGAVQSYLAIMVETDGLAGIEAFFVVAAIASGVGRPAFGIWADKRGYLMPLITGFASTFIGLVLLFLVKDSAMLLTAAALQGLGYSTCFSLVLSVASRSAAPDRRGTATATVMVGFDIGAGLSSVFYGLFASHYGFHAVFAVAAVIPIVAIVVFWLKGPRKDRSGTHA